MSPKVNSLDSIIKEQAIQFADQIKKAAEFAEKEEEIRIAAERSLAVIQKETGITLRGRHEYTIGTGRVDSVYGCVIIEYKNPHDPSARLSLDKNAVNNRKVIEQIQKRFSDFKKEYNMPLNTMFGVGCDGNYFIFVRFREGKWFVEDPEVVSRYSAERFLWALINMGTKGKAFSPEYLAGDFGSDSSLSHEGIKALYDTICSTSNSKAKIFFQQWKILFGEVCGYDVTTPSDKIKHLAEFYGISGQIKPSELLFSIHTYYSIFMKLLASEIVAFFHKLPTPLQRILKAPTSNKLKEEMEDLESGSIFRHLNITNFLEGDLFAWYTNTWNDSIGRFIRDIANRLDGYNPGTLSEDPAGSRDLLKRLYQELFPKSVRHDLGEYYTPDWLAEHVLNELEYEGDPDKRLLDPACGSGTFLIMVINRIRKWYDEHRDRCGYDEGDLARKILKNVVGFDLNPLAVMAARTNYLIAMKDLVSRVEKVEIPVYLCDSILTPSEYGGLDTWTSGEHVKTKELKTSAANFKIPLEIAQDREKIAKYAELLESCVRNSYRPDEFLERCKNEGLSISAEDLHFKLYEELVKLDKENKNGVWARIIKNSFAPLFVGKFDYVAGNPPWINWASLPENYRREIIPLYEDFYKLFPIKGILRRLGSAKIDISTLFVYVSTYEYLIEEGRLGFVITQSLFKSKSGGEGFRKFILPNKKYIVPLKVDDLTDLRPFEEAANRTAIFICNVEDKPPRWPVPYTMWKKSQHISINQEMNLDEVKRNTYQILMMADPIDRSVNTSPWLTIPASAYSGVRKATSKSYYIAHEGVNTGGLNGCYWLNILKTFENGKEILVENMHTVGKKKLKRVQMRIESKYVYPLLRGRDISRWRAHPSAHILMVHDPTTRIGVDEWKMKEECPKTYAYLKKFEKNLLERSSSSVKELMKKGAFYSMWGVGEYTFSRYKVMWRYISTELATSVIRLKDSYKDVIPDHRIVFIPLNNEEEAFFVSGILNSSPSKLIVKGFVIGTQMSPHILNYIGVPRYDPKNPFHKKVSLLSKRCHIIASKGDTKTLAKLEAEIDKNVAKIWNITDDELKEIQKALKEMEKSRKRKKLEKKIIINRKDDNIDKIELETKTSDDLLHEKVSSNDLMHLSHKAKYNNLLTPRERKALFDIPRLKSKGYKLSQKQIDYLEEIIRKAIDQGILDAPCNHHECEICNRIKEALKNSKD